MQVKGEAGTVRGGQRSMFRVGNVLGVQWVKIFQRLDLLLDQYVLEERFVLNLY